MKTVGNLLIAFMAFFMMLTFISCDKQEMEKDEPVAKTSVKDYLKVLNAFSLSEVEEITSGEDNTTKSAEILDCVTLTIHPNGTDEFWPRSWTLDFGEENCECFNGIYRRGKIHVSLSDWWRNEGSLREVTFEDFYFNNDKLSGVKTYLNTGLNESGNLTFTKTVSDAQLSYGDTATMSWESVKFSELIEGTESFKFDDDVWSVTGGGTGTNVDGKAFTFNINSALIYKNGCYFPVSGIIEFNAEGEEPLFINYGNGDCDSAAGIKVGDGEEKTIDL